jgi:hypothetical protein
VVVPHDETVRAKFAVPRKQHDGTLTDLPVVTRQGRGFAHFTIRVECTGAARELVTISEVTTSELPSGSFIFTRQRVWDGEQTDERLLVSTDNIG